jgi:hypothetical protein
MDERILVGLDFPYGYPAGFAAALGLTGTLWKATWEHLACQIEDDARNVSNRFEVAAAINSRLGGDAPFWGRPAHLALPSLPAKKDVVYRGAQRSTGLSEWRQVERCLHESGATPQSVWKLAYAGSVGSQTLVGLPVLHRLRNHETLRGVSRVWPFEIDKPDLPVGVPAVIHAEIWPSIVPFGHQEGSCKDEQQVRAVVECWRELDRENQLGTWFTTPDEDRVRCEEGWVLGVPDALSLNDLDSLKAKAATPRQPRGVRALKPTTDHVDRPPCLCGCGNYPRGKHSRFMPGHDQRRNPATGRPFNAH